MEKPLLPGATIGVLGSGQLGRMMAQAAIRLGYRVRCFSPDMPPTPCAQVGADAITASYEDLDQVADFAKSVDAVTFEFENVSFEAAEICARFAPVRPGGNVLHTTQNRLREKTFLRANHFPTPDFWAVNQPGDLDTARFPGVLKTAGFGYDGKGQRTVRSLTDARAALAEQNNALSVLEAFIDFDYEVSVVAARGQNGEFAAFPAVRNDHANHILDITTAPAPNFAPKLRRDAESLARAIFEKLNVVGVLCIELFVTKNGDLLVNELAPRPHNSGHWSIEGAATSQFEQQVRAVCGLPLGSTRRRTGGAAMANLLGDLWGNGTPHWNAALKFPDVALHLYGKQDARPGRKMGHLTALDDTPEAAAEKVRAARNALK